MICRPFESAALVAPLSLAMTWRAWRSQRSEDRIAWALVVAGVLVPVSLFLAHAHAVTGGWIPARHSAGGVGFPTLEEDYWVRFGSNVAFNALRLAVWFAGPLGVLLSLIGATTRRLCLWLGLGVVCALLVGLAHDNYGIGAVGPIHYSECVVPLTLLAVHGLATVTRRVRALGLDARVPPAIALVWFTLGHGAFTMIHNEALIGQALIQSQTYQALEDAIPAEQRPAVVLAPQFGKVWNRTPEFRARGCWVFEWRRPHPDFSDEILILHGGPGDESVRAAFPDRHVFSMQPGGEPPYFKLTQARLRGARD